MRYVKLQKIITIYDSWFVRVMERTPQSRIHKKLNTRIENTVTAEKGRLSSERELPYRMYYLPSQCHQADSNKNETYIGLCETTFKNRFANHKNLFHSKKKKKEKKLSKFIWTLKKQNILYNITWSIVKRCKTYNNSNKKCFLCNAENHIIICQPHRASLTKQENGTHINLPTPQKISTTYSYIILLQKFDLNMNSSIFSINYFI